MAKSSWLVSRTQLLLRPAPDRKRAAQCHAARPAAAAQRRAKARGTKPAGRAKRIWRTLVLGSLFFACRTRLLDGNEPTLDGATRSDLAAADLASTRPAAWPMLGHDARHSGRSERIGAQTASIKWSLPIQMMRVISFPTIAGDGTIYVGAADQKLHAIDSAGHEKWTFAAAGTASAAALGEDGSICFGRLDGSAAQHEGLYAVDETGALRWQLDGNHPNSAFTALGAPTRFGGTTYASVFDETAQLCAVDGNGHRRWCSTTSSNTATALDSPPAVDSDGTSYVGAIDQVPSGSLHAIDSAGHEKWKIALDHYPMPPALGDEGTIYFNSGSTLYAVTPAGTIKWKRSGSGSSGSTPAIGPDGTAVYGADRSLDAVDTAGALKWQFATTAAVGPPIVDAAGTVYVGALDSNFYAIDARGQLKWKLAANSKIDAPAAIGSDGTVYFASENSLYAVGP